MATVTNIANRVCRYSGLATTGNDRTLVLEYINDAYKDAVQRSIAYVRTSATITLTSGTHTYTISSSPFSLSDVERLLRIRSTGSTPQLLSRVSPSTLQRMRDGRQSYSGPLTHYASFTPGSITFYPTPSTGDTVTVDYVAVPPTLVESGAGAGEETTPSVLPARFHHNVISTGAIAYALDSDQNADADRWWQRYENAIADLQAWVNEYAGEQQVDEHWITKYRLHGARDMDIGP